MEKSSYLKAGSEGQSPDSAPSCAEAGGSTASPPAGGALQAAAGGPPVQTLLYLTSELLLWLARRRQTSFPRWKAVFQATALCAVGSTQTLISTKWVSPASSAGKAVNPFSDLF